MAAAAAFSLREKRCACGLSGPSLKLEPCPAPCHISTKFWSTGRPTMPMAATEIEKRILAAIPDAKVEISASPVTATTMRQP